MRNLLLSVVTVVLVSANAFAAECWRDKLPEGRLYSDSQFLTSKEVQSKLRLTDEQIAGIKSAKMTIAKRSEASFAQLKKQGVKFDSEGFKLMQQAAAAIEIEESNRILDSLKEDQQRRAVEISLQIGGVLALQYRELAMQLKLSDEQRDRIDATFAEFEEKLGAAIAEHRKEPKLRDQAQQRLRLARRDAVEAILTDEQRAKYQSLKGELWAWAKTEN
jgi:hypothetical protein